jgi:hypothetical protein
MKRSTIFIVLCLCFVSANAQKIIEKHISFSGKEITSLNIQIADSIRIIAWNKNEVYIRGSVNVNTNKDNESYQVTTNETGRAVNVDARFSENYFKGKKNCCNESEIFWEIYLPENTKFTVETINGNITVTGKTKAMTVKSISGYIDLAIPSDRSADVELSTISGRMYSDLNLGAKKEQSEMPMKIVQKLNNGGDPIRLETISGDIFFRKAVR